MNSNSNFLFSLNAITCTLERMQICGFNHPYIGAAVVVVVVVGAGVIVVFVSAGVVVVVVGAGVVVVVVGVGFG